MQRETAPAVAWVPVRYVDGVEEFEPVTVTRRTPEGDALAATGARLERLVALIERTRALLAAERAIGGLRCNPARGRPLGLRSGPGADRAVHQPSQETHMRDSKGRFPPERQRRFDRTFHEIERLCPGRAGRVSDWCDALLVEVDPAEIERVRWLLIFLSHARATPGSLAIAALAHRGYAISTWTGPSRTTPEIAALDTPGLVHLGHVLPSSYRPWKWMEQVALGVDPMAWPERRWCSAHETLRIRAALAAEGHTVK